MYVEVVAQPMVGPARCGARSGEASRGAGGPGGRHRLGPKSAQITPIRPQPGAKVGETGAIGASSQFESTSGVDVEVI